jgi:hypothetical protein
MFDVVRSTVNAFAQLRLNPWFALGDVLLVGEGNLSFAKSLLHQQPLAQITQMTATTFENGKELSQDAIEAASWLKSSGAMIVHGVDATRLDKKFKQFEYDTIIFQFPHVGSREAKYGHNPNHILVRNFLRSASVCLKPDGKVLITAVNNPHYRGAFQFDDAAVFAGYEVPETYPFDPSDFSGYSHINTNDEESAIEDHRRFATWVFRLKP